MGPLVLHSLGEKRSKMWRFSIHHNKSHLSIGNIEQEGAYLGLVAMKRTCIGVLIGADIGSITQSCTV
jgi:hypothetical protein